MKHFSRTKRMVIDGMLAAVALSVFVIELQLPSLIPIPGIKPGLSNIITLVTLYLIGPWDALAVLLVRITLGCIITGRMMAFAYSLGGGILSFFILLLLWRRIDNKILFVCSIFSAMAHNLGQILVAILLTKTVGVLYYLPVLEVSGIITGLFTGLVAQLVIKRLKKVYSNE